MNVFIVVLMMILLPLQAAWSAAATFCQHENHAKWHWGHHQHQMDAVCQQANTHYIASNKNPELANTLVASPLFI